MKKILSILLLSFSLTSCIFIDDNCSCTQRTYEVVEYNGEIVDTKQVGYESYNGDCARTGTSIITNVRYSYDFKYYTLTEIYCY